MFYLYCMWVNSFGFRNFYSYGFYKRTYKHSEGKLCGFTPIKIKGEFSQVEERFKRIRQLPVIKT